ncbi:MAG TPA: amino acid adenylation domain-containing protein, partial [Longimicrobiaceae bacterium]
SDEWSTGVLVRELSALYDAFSRGEPSPLPELPIQYVDYAVWQRRTLSEEALEAQLAFWRERLAGAPPVLELPTDHPRPDRPTMEAGSRPFVLDAGTSAAFRALAHAEGATLFAAGLAAWQALLARWSGQDDVLVGTPVANRGRAELEGLIGFLVNTLVLRADFSEDPTVRQLLARTRTAVWDAQENQDVPFERLVEELVPERSLAHSPLFQVMFSFQGAAGEDVLRLGGVEMELLDTETGRAKFDLLLSVVDAGERIVGRAEYRAELFDGATVERLLEHYAALLAGMAADPERRVSEIGLLGEAERRRVVEEWNATERAYPSLLPVHEGFAAQTRRTPDAVAVRWAGGTQSYADLERESNRLARHLRRRGVGAEARVGICMERGPEMVAAVLGVLKAGAAYVPLDPEYPAERLAWMLEDSGAAVLLATRSVAERLPSHAVDTVLVDEEPTGAGPDTAPGVSASPDTLAYVIYTSGSTGTPKGVAVPHGALSNHMAWMGEEFPLGPGDRVLQKTSFSFDASVWELWAPLLSGAELVLAAPGAQRDPAQLVRTMGEEGVTVVQFVPTQLQVLLEEPGFGELRGVRRIFCGGEAFPAGAAARAGVLTGAEVVNLYGPTEACIDATWHVPTGEETRATLPIGRPVANVRAYVLERGGAPAPVGVPGELYLAGAQLARGYLGRPELTAERFVPDPFGEPGGRLYRTGDRARWLAEGRLEYLGRADEQVKLRGFRVEPGEVEAALLEHPAVREAAVAVRGDRLVGYVVAENGGAPEAGLRGWLRERLPEHMVPSAVVALDALPRTPAGKLARRALPAPDGAAEAKAYVAPRTPTERLVAEAWAAALQVERVGALDGFFELGGHSLLGTRVVSRLREALGVEVPLRAVFEAPTLAAFAERVDALRPAPAEEEPSPDELPADTLELSPEQLQLLALMMEDEGLAASHPDDVSAESTSDEEEHFPLSFAQQRLWLVDRLEPGSAAYNVPFALRLRGALDVRALEEALSEIVFRHESLHTVFAEVDGEPVQVIGEPWPVRMEVTDLAALPAEEREEAVRAEAREEASRPFDLARGPLLRARLLRMGADEVVALLTL